MKYGAPRHRTVGGASERHVSSFPKSRHLPGLGPSRANLAWVPNGQGGQRGEHRKKVHLAVYQLNAGV